MSCKIERVWWWAKVVMGWTQVSSAGDAASPGKPDSDQRQHLCRSDHIVMVVCSCLSKMLDWEIYWKANPPKSGACLGLRAAPGWGLTAPAVFVVVVRPPQLGGGTVEIMVRQQTTPLLWLFLLIQLKDLKIYNILRLRQKTVAFICFDLSNYFRLYQRNFIVCPSLECKITWKHTTKRLNKVAVQQWC